MKKLLPFLAALPLLALTSCTAVVDPTPASTSTTTVHSEQAMTRPAAVSTTTTRSTGGY
ncbi:MAG: hypothetical protein M3505_04595 [Verrucomicrobiota bacterium]|nr:hypothetical protein [Chthoniobacterales bacterium]MBA3763299.1 hypothetical protein [Chthoniobacterales bacterium]MDQ3313896.1 hypothetical protein [Verrucomicrobiota bacterium]